VTLVGRAVLVTGATGFLGGALARRLARDGARVRALARRPERGAALRATPGVELAYGDVTDEGRMRDVLRGCDIAFHAAGVLDGSLAAQRRVNVDGTRNVVRAAADAGVGRVVHVSSAGAYGFGGPGDVSEDTPLRPGHAAYGVTKAEAEGVVRQIGRERGLACSIIRPGMIYGPGSRVWTEVMFTIARRNPTLFPGDGSGSIPAIYLDDVVDLMTVLAVHPAAAGETFNCTPDPSPTWREFLGAYAALAGHRRWVAIPVTPLRVVARLVAAVAPGDTRLKDLPQVLGFVTSARRFRMDKARARLAWAPRIPLHEGIARCAPYLREKGLLDGQDRSSRALGRQ
jgi:nucleoside-diphosphate-sugar epimerase